MTEPSVYRNMRIGLVAHYPAPSGLEGWAKHAWLITNAGQMGLGVQQISVTEYDPDEIQRLRELAGAQDVALEALAMGLWNMVGPDAAEGRAQLEKAIHIAQGLGANILRANHGRGKVAMSRFSKEWPRAEHMDFCARNLRAAGEIVAEYGMRIGVESYSDFTGLEWAQIFAQVDLPNVGAMLDTANGITVFCDPNDDVQHLARYAINAHLKDIKIVEWDEPGQVPFIPVGCALGEGHVDIPLAIKTMAEQSPYADGLHLVIEVAWFNVPPGRDRNDVLRELFDRSIDYLRGVLTDLAQKNA